MKKFIVPIVVAIVFAGAGFYGGIKYDQSQSSTQRQQRAQQFGNGGANGNNAFRLNGSGGGAGRNGGGFTSGQIIAKDATSITVKTQDGSSKIVFYSNTTSVGKAVNGTPSDLTVGENVTITGTANSDGSVTAQSVQIRPAMPSPTATP